MLLHRHIFQNSFLKLSHNYFANQENYYLKVIYMYFFIESKRTKICFLPKDKCATSVNILKDDALESSWRKLQKYFKK